MACHRRHVYVCVRVRVCRCVRVHCIRYTLFDSMCYFDFPISGIVIYRPGRVTYMCICFVLSWPIIDDRRWISFDPDRDRLISAARQTGHFSSSHYTNIRQTIHSLVSKISHKCCYSWKVSHFIIIYRTPLFVRSMLFVVCRMCAVITMDFVCASHILRIVPGRGNGSTAVRLHGNK